LAITLAIAVKIPIKPLFAVARRFIEFVESEDT